MPQERGPSGSLPIGKGWETKRITPFRPMNSTLVYCRVIVYSKVILPKPRMSALHDKVFEKKDYEAPGDAMMARWRPWRNLGNFGRDVCSYLLRFPDWAMIDYLPRVECGETDRWGLVDLGICRLWAPEAWLFFFLKPTRHGNIILDKVTQDLSA